MSLSTTDSSLEASIRKLAFWLDTVSAYLDTTVACLGGDFNQDAVIAHIKVSFNLNLITLRKLVEENFFLPTLPSLVSR